MRSVYLDEAEKVARQSFSRWNREPASPSYGSFDRQYWGWKYKDFSDTTLQYGVRLAIEYAAARQLTGNLPALLEGYVAFCESVQLPDGSFNQCYPYERSPGVVYDVLSTLIDIRRSPFLGSNDVSGRVDRIILRAVGFVLRTDEKHGEVANHLAHYAYELFNYAEFSGDQRAKRKAEHYVERFLRSFEASEGWFLEYSGPDPGYQTRCLRFLVKIADLTGSSELWTKAGLAAGFIDEVLMPDGSIHPMLGCRSTALVYPSAFERLACRDPKWRNLAARIRGGWECRKVPMPSELDYGNAIRLADDALDAYRHFTSRQEADQEYQLPVGDKDLPAAGIHIRRSRDRMVFVGSRIGGVVVVYAKSPETGWQLAYEDSGYLLKSGREAWLTRMPGIGISKVVDKDRISIEAPFARSLHDEVTPLKLILLRILNLTFLRVQWIGDTFRKLVVGMLMSGIEPEALKLSREVVFVGESLRISDIITGSGRLLEKRFDLFRCRRIIGTHMASSRYFQDAELKDVGIAWTQRLPWPDSVGKVTDTVLQRETA